MFTTLSAEDLALKVPFSEAVGIAGAAGFAAVDLPMNELLADRTDPSAESIRESLEAAGLRAGGWWLPVEFREGEDQYRQGMDLLPRAGRLAKALHSPWCITWIWPFSDELDFASNMELHVKRLRPAAATLAEFDCMLGLEFVGPQTLRQGHKYEFISTLSETLDMADRIGGDNVGVLLDCWQWYTSNGTVAELDALDREKVVYVHLNDAPTGLDVSTQIDDQRMLPGSTGVIDVAGFLQALRRLDFKGPVAVEPFNADVNRIEPLERARVARRSVDVVVKKSGVSIE